MFLTMRCLRSLRLHIEVKVIHLDNFVVIFDRKCILYCSCSCWDPFRRQFNPTEIDSVSQLQTTTPFMAENLHIFKVSFSCTSERNVFILLEIWPDTCLVKFTCFLDSLVSFFVYHIKGDETWYVSLCGLDNFIQNILFKSTRP